MEEVLPHMLKGYIESVSGEGLGREGKGIFGGGKIEGGGHVMVFGLQLVGGV